MSVYENFAYVYDELMKDIPYKKWIEYLENIFLKHRVNPKTILDLGCGTGNISLLLAEKGYKVTGLDLSVDMLSVAKNKEVLNEQDIFYICQDMRNLELDENFDAIISLFDSINYLLEEEEILKLFKTVKEYLNPDGIFVFDLNTEYKFSEILSNNTFSAIEEDFVCAWENFYDTKTKIAEYYTNFFIKKENDLYKRFEEIHYEKAYNTETIKNLLDRAGFELVEVFEAFTFENLKEKSERVYFVAK